jgi:hypothetical protein
MKNILYCIFFLNIMYCDEKKVDIEELKFFFHVIRNSIAIIKQKKELKDIFSVNDFICCKKEIQNLILDDFFISSFDRIVNLFFYENFYIFDFFLLTIEFSNEQNRFLDVYKIHDAILACIFITFYCVEKMVEKKNKINILINKNNVLRLLILRNANKNQSQEEYLYSLFMVLKSLINQIIILLKLLNNTEFSNVGIYNNNLNSGGGLYDNLFSQNSSIVNSMEYNQCGFGQSFNYCGNGQNFGSGYQNQYQVNSNCFKDVTNVIVLGLIGSFIYLIFKQKQ